MRVLVVIPTYNERATIGPQLTALWAHVPEAHALVVDDNSPDGTAEICRKLAATESRLFVLQRGGKQGLGTAYVAGFEWALARGYDVICEMDADGSHDPARLPALLAALEAGADVAIGSRYVAGGGTQNWGLGRQLMSRGGSVYARRILGMRVADMTAGYVAWRAAALRDVGLADVRANGYGFQVEMKYRAHLRGLRLVEVPILFTDRRVGQSKMSRAIFVEAMLRVWELRLRKPRWSAAPR